MPGRYFFLFFRTNAMMVELPFTNMPYGKGAPARVFFKNHLLFDRGTATADALGTQPT